MEFKNEVDHEIWKQIRRKFDKAIAQTPYINSKGNAVEPFTFTDKKLTVLVACEDQRRFQQKGIDFIVDMFPERIVDGCFVKSTTKKPSVLVFNLKKVKK